ncbi:hypothetical protein EHW66_21250 [Erwinia psidii]|uniref:hypothetical protein n=1 Tax=Erwinia psidii TaxID=69224 RepID=UPI00226B5BA8|nr:hypothetical protein [Erwinia psidii]MCX8967397.1 hypothetical protein [Erwinia psidii]
MATEITPQQAEDMSRQAELISSMLEDYPHNLLDTDVSLIAALLKNLTGKVASYLMETNNQNN